MLKSNLNPNVKLLFILLVALLLRLYGLQWDSGFHLHPDERMLLFVADRIQFFHNLDPNFFNYGSLPIYLLKGISQLIDTLFSTTISNYLGMLYVGRYLSILFDVITVFLIYKTTRLLGNDERTAFFASFIYAIAIFPIQNAHFFTVDTLLTCLSTLFIYQLLLFFKHHSWKLLTTIGITFAAMMATKITAIVFLPVVLLLIILRAWSHWKKIIIHLFIFNLSLLISYFIFMPYAFLDYKRFISDTLLQTSMAKNPYQFPYTLQFVDTIPYWHYLKQVFIWGWGPFISILSLVGLVYFVLNIVKKYSRSKLILFVFLACYLWYFIIIGVSAVKFMRYLLPLYPFFAIMAGYGLTAIKKTKLKIIRLVIVFLLSGGIIWSLMFVNIYSDNNTRINASQWILNNIPTGSSLAVEYWDDYLPLYKNETYRFQELHLYDQPDDSYKWEKIETQLKQSDYIIIASNRLYAPIQKLNDCSKYKVCFPIASDYYKKLLNNELPFKKIKEFSDYPSITIGKWKLELNDDTAEESFTVYDHPKIMIFKKI